MATGSTSAKSNKKESCVCPICDAVIRESAGRRHGQDLEAVECSGLCASWVHRQCAGLSKVAFQSVSTSTKPFFCPQCRLDQQELELISLRDLVGALGKEIGELRAQFSANSSAPVASEEHFAWGTDNSQAQSSVHHTMAVGTGVSVGSHLATATKEKVPDRETNLIICGIAESEKGTFRHIRNRADIENAGEILSVVDPYVTANMIA